MVRGVHKDVSVFEIDSQEYIVWDNGYGACMLKHSD